MISLGGCWVLDDGCWWLAKDGCKVLCNRLTWCLCEPLCVLFFCVFLWEIERTHSMRWHTNNSLGRFFSHRTHRFNRTLLRTVSNSQKASGRQRTQNVTAIVDINKVQHEAYILFIGVSRWLLPFPSGEGKGEGPLSLWTFVCSVLLCFSVRKRKHLRVVGRFFSHRAHRVHWAFWRTFRAHRRPSAYREHRAFQLS